LRDQDKFVSRKERTIRNLTKNLWDSTTGSGLCCVWVLVHDDGGDRLVSIWIDLALTALRSCARETADGIGAAATRFAGHQKDDVELFAGDHLTPIHPRRS
jgi:hypothetical protein